MNGKRRKAAVNFDVLWYWAHCDNILLARAVKHLPTGCWTSARYIPTHHGSYTSTPGHMQRCVNRSGCEGLQAVRPRYPPGGRCQGGSPCERVCLMGKLIACYQVQPSKREKRRWVDVKLVVFRLLLDTSAASAGTNFDATLSTFPGWRWRERCCPQSTGCW